MLPAPADRKRRVMTRMPFTKFAAAAALALSVAACATPFRADVSRFESQLPAPQGQSFYVLADDPALAGGLEFALYADRVEFHDVDGEIAPGVTVHRVGGHSDGLQVVRVETARGPVVPVRG